MPAPIVIFAFNRPDKLRNLLNSLKQNKLYAESTKYFFIDGPRSQADVDAVNEVIEIARQESDLVEASPTNKGLAKSVIAGITKIVNQHGKIIVLEDDLYCAPLFLEYMNRGLDLYQSTEQILSVCGYGLKINKPKDYQGDIYLSLRSSSWGWGTWANRWNRVDWELNDWPTLKDDKAIQRGFNKGGSDMFGMLADYKAGRNNSWAIRFCFHQFRNGLYSVHPFQSLIENDGYGLDASNCRQTYSRFHVDFNQSTSISSITFPLQLTPSEAIHKSLRRYHSISIRIYSKIRKLLNL